MLLVPTTRISGIEDPEILAPDAPNYWEAAWEARRYLEKRVGAPLPRDQIGLAVNSIPGRSQNQLHIHIGCVRPAVLKVLRRNEGQVGATWTTLSKPLSGDVYQAMRAEAEDLRTINPFQLLANMKGMAPKRMGDQTLVVVGTIFNNGRDGFYILNNGAEPENGDFAEGEHILARRCAISALPG